MSASKLLAVTAFVVTICVSTLVMVQTNRASQPQPAQPGSSAVIFEKGKRYVLLHQEGLARFWSVCAVQDAKDNWVKCDGGLLRTAR